MSMVLSPDRSFPPVMKSVVSITILAEFTLPLYIWIVFLVPTDVMYSVHSKLSGWSLSLSLKLPYIPPHTMMSPLASNPPVAPYFGTVSKVVNSEQADPMLPSTVKTLLLNLCPVELFPPMTASLSEIQMLTLVFNRKDININLYNPASRPVEQFW